jgi:hypothetical protein
LFFSNHRFFIAVACCQKSEGVLGDFFELFGLKSVNSIFSLNRSAVSKTNTSSLSDVAVANMCKMKKKPEVSIMFLRGDIKILVQALFQKFLLYLPCLLYLRHIKAWGWSKHLLHYYTDSIQPGLAAKHK